MGRQARRRPTGFRGFLEQGETSAPSLASLFVDPEVREDVTPVHGAELLFAVVALDPWLGDTEQGSYWPPDRPQLLGDAQVGLPQPLLLLLYRDSGPRILEVLVKNGVAVVRGMPGVLRIVCRDRHRGTSSARMPWSTSQMRRMRGFRQMSLTRPSRLKA